MAKYYAYVEKRHKDSNRWPKGNAVDFAVLVLKKVSPRGDGMYEGDLKAYVYSNFDLESDEGGNTILLSVVDFEKHTFDQLELAVHSIVKQVFYAT